MSFRQFLVPASMPLYRRLVIEGDWWDFVDEIRNSNGGNGLA